MSGNLKKTFCIYPFVQTVVRTSGNLGPCCNMRTGQQIHDTTIESFWSSDQIKDIRTNLINGVEVPGCSVCYNEESKFGTSIRTKALVDYKFYSDKHYIQLLDYYKLQNTKFPKRLELHLGNLCNLKCLTCRPTDSSAFLAENRALKISDHNQHDYQLSDDKILSIMSSAIENKIELLDLRGGETMLMPIIKNILLEWPQDHADKLTIRIQTNCTIMDSDWEKIFKKFKQFDIMMSIDGHGIDNEYIRYPSKWSDIERNVEILTSLPNAKTYVNCTISNLNFLSLPRLIDWCKQRNVFFHWSIVDDPVEFRYTNLPLDLFTQAQQALINYPEVQALMTHKADDTNWDRFCQIINVRDNYRKNRIFDILPQLKNYWKEQ